MRRASVTIAGVYAILDLPYPHPLAPSEIAKVLRDMYRLKFDKDLSFGERRLLDQARSLLVQELALAKKVAPSAMEGEIQQIFSA